MTASEAKILRTSLRAMFAKADNKPGAVAKALAETGWEDVLPEDPQLGAVIFEELGRAGAVSSLLDDILLAHFNLDSKEIAIAYPVTTRASRFDSALDPATPGMVHAVLRRPIRSAGRILVGVLDEADPRVFIVAADQLRVTKSDGLDSDGGWSTVHGGVDLTQADADLSGGWTELVSHGRCLMAGELVGLAEAALEVAVRYTTERHQFGRSIGSFQSVRFRLAEAKVAIEAAREAIRVGFAIPGPLSGALAKALAGQAAEASVRHATQVTGAMGSTWDFPLHRMTRRTLAVDAMLGGWQDLSTALGRNVVETQHVPQLDPLLVAPEA